MEIPYFMPFHFILGPERLSKGVYESKREELCRIVKRLFRRIMKRSRSVEADHCPVDC